MKAYGATDIGLHRAENQDSFSISECGAYTIAVVCDGMGGATAGKTASSMAVSTFLSTLSPLLNDDSTMEQVREMASFSVAQANHALFAHAEKEPSCRGMGTTLVCAICPDNRAAICNVGDSRAYLVGSSGITQLTHDHSVVETMVENGDITSEQARTHPSRHLITRALGPESSVPCDTYLTEMKEGELLLLCSDGLVVTASDEEILRAIWAEERCEDRLERLVELSKKHGAPDNVTVLLIENR